MALDAHSRAFLEALAEKGAKPFHQIGVPEARNFMEGLRDIVGPGPDMYRVEDLFLDQGGHALHLRVLAPESRSSGIVVYCHGGGWALMSIDDYDAAGRHIAYETGCTVLLVDYRLAPEHPYPAAIDDVWLALEWAATHREALNGSPHAPLIVAGDSAGGNLAAVVTQRAHARGGPEIAQQLLIYPVTQDDLNTPCYLDPDNQALLGQEDMRWFWDLYLPDTAARQASEASPLRAKSFRGLPPAIVITAEHDVLRDEGEAYAAALQSAGVHVDHRRFAGQMHGFFGLDALLPASAEARGYLAQAVRTRLGELCNDAERKDLLLDR
ncbi:alpha/beta hydrolase [Paraburkholderia sp. GAS348]|uniref:alpha/beta hydrolase n=1 Tax=Paraburkholderia sp. GAS348 TaxID=3035132 RepID=UPI003D251282